MASDVMGSGPGWPPPVTIEARVSGIVVTFCLFFGCGSTVEESWISTFHRRGRSMVSVHVRWRVRSGRTKVGFRIYHHV